MRLINFQVRISPVSVSGELEQEARMIIKEMLAKNLFISIAFLILFFNVSTLEIFNFSVELPCA